MTGAARRVAPSQREACATPNASRPASTPGKRKRPNNTRTTAGIENSSNATTPSDMDPYDIMSFDGWTAPEEKTKVPHRPASGSQTPLKRRATVARDKNPVPGRSAKPVPSTPLLPTEATTTNRAGAGAKFTAGAPRHSQTRRKSIKLEAVANPQPSRLEAQMIRNDVSLVSAASPPAQRSKRPRRRRLIDALADQAPSSSDEEVDHVDVPRIREADPFSTPVKGELGESPGRRTGQALKPPGSVKLTYGAQRSILRVAGSGDMDGDIALLSPLPVSDTPASSGLEFSFPAEDSDDDETSHKGAVRSIHELRQAGANNRFADEIDDLLDRIGSPQKEPISLRRNALLEIAVKLHDKRFLRQFRDYGTHGSLFDELDKEDDTISGFALVSALLTLLTANAAPRAYKYLEAGISRLLRKLLHHKDDISLIAGQRSSNVSRNTRATIASLRTTVLKLDVWESGATALSPRSLALKFISVAFGSSEGPACMEAFAGLADDLFSILQLVPQPMFLENCSDVEKEDCSAVASVLQELSVGAMVSEQVHRWTKDYPDTISGALDAVLRRSTRLPDSFEESLLKLAMNCTNNDEPAAPVWYEAGRLGDLARSASTCFSSVKDGVSKGEWNAEGYNRLLLLLGLLINLCEHAPSLELSLDNDVLDGLIRAYLDSYSSTKEADSVEKTQFNVAVGYLAIVVGYLSLSTPVRQRLEVMDRMDGLERLADSITEFIAFYETVDSRKDTGGHVGRLQGLVRALKK